MAYPASDTFLAAAQTSSNQHLILKMEALLNGVVQATVENQYAQDSNGIWQVVSPSSGFAIAGTVNVDVTSQVRRTIPSMTLVDPAKVIVPYLGIYGPELRVYRGLLLSTGPEYVPLATVRLTDVQALEAPALSYLLQGSDRSLTVAERSWIDPYTIAAGTNIGAAIQAIIEAAIPWVPFSPGTFSSVTSQTVPATVTYSAGTDPWKTCQALALSAGLDLYFGPMGTCNLVPVSTEVGGPITWSFIDGENQMAVTSGTKDQSTTACSAYVVTGQTTTPGQPPVRGIAYDNDPTSDTYYLGPFGTVPQFTTTNLVNTAAAAQTYATAQLQLFSGRAKRFLITCVPNPAHEENDVIHCKNSVDDQVQIIEKMTIPFEATGLQSIQSRKLLSGDVR
jgi:hypothetical protein